MSGGGLSSGVPPAAAAAAAAKEAPDEGGSAPEEIYMKGRLQLAKGIEDDQFMKGIKKYLKFEKGPKEGSK